MSRSSLEFKKLVDYPLFIIRTSVLFNKVLIHVIKVCLKPIFFRTANRKLWSTELNAFSISTVNRIPSSLEFSI